MKAFISFALVAFALVHGQETEGPQVDTYFGKVKGAPGESRDGRMYYQFHGIPYGKVPTRFQAPEMPDMWEGVKDTTAPAPSCIHFNVLKKEVEGQEDCLNLNVFTPRLPKEGEDTILLPTVVYLHPGLNKFGTSEDGDPKYWMDEDVVVVMINWRQSLFGFLNTGDMYAPGNQGLRDQTQALKWVQQNIEKFGGDKSRVTLMGTSSGGADAFFHTLSPLSKGLIHNVIDMSGSPFSRQSVIRDPVRQAKKLGKQVDCPTDSSQALVMCLREKDAKEILNKIVKTDITKITPEDLEAKAWFGPSIEKKAEGQTDDDLFIPEHPLKLMKEGKVVNKVPIIIGGNEMDGINLLTAKIYKHPELMEKLDKQWNEIAPLLFLYKDTAVDKDIVSSKLKQYYFGDKPINKDTYLNLTNIFLDRFIAYPTISTARIYLKSAPVYFYYFMHKPEVSGVKFLGIDMNFGMANLDELQYLFKSKLEKIPYPEITKEHKEYELSKGLVKMLSSFIETGKPSKVWGEGKEWKKNEVGGEIENWYKIDTKSELETPPEDFMKRMEFWQELYSKELAKEKETPEVSTFDA